MIYRRARMSLLAAAVAAGVVVPGAGHASALAAPGTTTGPTVTLLTGDVVTLGGVHGVHVQAAKGREHVSFQTRKDERGDLHVIPEDAAVPLARGKLDPRLFDVTALARAGYDDASRDRLPLIVDYPGATPRVAGAQVSRELPTMSAAAVSIERTAVFWPAAQNAERVWLDGPVRATLDHSVPQIGAPEAWAAGHTGAGATVAVLDTGIDTTHPDLADAVTGAQNFTDGDTTDDRFGHGTHVASTITGNSEKYRGVAPDAKLLNGKVLGDNGGGQESWIIAGMEWAAANADVVNMSLGDPWPSDGSDPMSEAVNKLTAETGALFVVSAGNSGPYAESIGSPAAADAALTVGAVDRDDQLADFSSRGPRWENGAIKPDITAPGVDIVAAKAAHGVIGEPAGEGYVSMSGTSMAAPHVAGAAAILAAQHQDWPAERLKATLMGSAKPNGPVFEQGAGRVDVAAADTATVSASPASLSIGTVQWPHDDDQPVASAVTYTNTGAEPVTFDLAADVTGPDGSAAPQGMFTVEPATLTVPAGGQATATLTTNTKVEAADGQYSGVLTATAADRSVRTPLAVNREVESYDVTVNFLDPNGAPTGEYFSRFVNVDNRKAYLANDPSGTTTVRLPKGEFYFETTFRLPDRTALFAEPAFTVTGDATVVVDARQAKPIGFTVDRPNARSGAAFYQALLTTAWGETGTAMMTTNFDDVLVAPATTAKKDKFTFTVEMQLAEWNGESFAGSPYLYHLRRTENDTVPQTLSWHAPDRKLAKVRSEHAVATPGMTGMREYFLPLSLPATLTEYYTPNVPWSGSFATGPDPMWDVVSSVRQVEPRTYKLGRVTTERWNVGVFAPAFPDPTLLRDSAARLGDEINFDVPLHTDQGRGRAGYAAAEGTSTLLRDGEVVGEQPYPGGGLFDVRPEPATYILRTVANQPTARLSTQISAEWTFPSAHVAGEEPENLPLLAVRHAPDLDDHNAAPAGRRFTFPIFVDRNSAGETGRVNTPTVEVSYDDGATWQPAKVKHDKVTVDHPAGAEFVSLRSNVSDRDGYAQRLTIIRAYALR